jgi:hypothetical protein
MQDLVLQLSDDDGVSQGGSQGAALALSEIGEFCGALSKRGYP